MSLTEQQVDHFRRNGFVNGGPVLDDATVEMLRAETLRVIDHRNDPTVVQPVLLRNIGPGDERPIWQIVNIYEASPAFRELVSHPALTQMAAQLSRARELRVWHDQIQYKPQALGGRLHWHQDSPLWPTLQPKDAQLTAWVALDDAEIDNGCMYMVPGSHTWGDQKQFLASFPEGTQLPDNYLGRPVYEVMCPVRKGHVHFHHSLTWHGSGANTSSRPRRAIAIHFMTEKTCYDAGGEHPMKPFIKVTNGAPLVGDAFPLVWSAGK